MTISSSVGNIYQSMNISKQGIEVNSPEESRDKFAAFALEALAKICEDNYLRINGYQQNKRLLDRGIFYPNEYYVALKKVEEIGRLNFLKSNGHFYHGYAPKDWFEHSEDSKNIITHKECFVFVLKKGQFPTSGLEELCNGLTLMDCGVACNLAHNLALVKLIGSEKYNTIFATDSTTPLVIRHVYSSIRGLFSMEFPKSTLPSIKLGQMPRFANIDDYNHKHYLGVGGGYNVLCVNNDNPSQRFIGLGLDPNGVTKDQIVKELIDNYNKRPDDDSMITSEMRKRMTDKWPILKSDYAQKLKSNQLTDLEFNRQGGGQLSSIVDYKADRIFDLAKADIESAKKLMSKWHSDS